MAVVVPLLVVIGVAIALGASAGGSAPALPTAGAPADGTPVPRTAPALAAVRRPPDIAVAAAEGLQLRLPIERARVNAIAFHAIEDAGVVPLEPGGGLEHHTLPKNGRPGSDTATVDIAAAAGTPVWSPVDGSVLSVSPYIVSGLMQGYEILIRPSATAGLLVRMTHLQVPAGGEPPSVGQPVRAGETQIGEVVDFTVAEQEIARHTSDSGNHVHLELLRSELSYTP